MFCASLFIRSPHSATRALPKINTTQKPQCGNGTKKAAPSVNKHRHEAQQNLGYIFHKVLHILTSVYYVIGEWCVCSFRDVRVWSQCFLHKKWTSGRNSHEQEGTEKDMHSYFKKIFLSMISNIFCCFIVFVSLCLYIYQKYKKYIIFLNYFMNFQFSFLYSYVYMTVLNKIKIIYTVCIVYFGDR